MNHLLLSATFALSFAAASQAMPTPELFPDNLISLGAGDFSGSTFFDKLEARGVSYKTVQKTIDSEEFNALFTNEFYRAAMEIRSIAGGVTADSKSMLPNGFIAYAEGGFDAPGLMRKLIALDDVQEGLVKSVGKDVTVSIGQSPLGPSLVFTGNKEKMSGEKYPPMADGFVVTIEAVAPNTIRVASSGATPGNGRRALAPDSPFAALLTPENAGKGLSFHKRIAPFDRVVAGIIAKIQEVNPEAKERIDQVTAIPALNAFLTIRSYDAKLVELADRLQFTLTVEAASPDSAEEVSELLIGYKVLLKTAVGMLASQLNSESPEVIEAFKPLSDTFTAIISGIKVSPAEDSTVSAKVAVTLDQCETLCKSMMRLKELSDAEREARRKAWEERQDSKEPGPAKLRELRLDNESFE